VQFDDVGAGLGGGFDLLGRGIDEQRDADAGLAQIRNERRQPVVLARDAEAAFRGQFGAMLRHQAAGMRPVLQRDREHLLGHGHFEV
jgi:hypothetical protein